MKRAIVYIDGFNLYHSIDDQQQSHLKWIDYPKLAYRLIDTSRELLVKTVLYSAWAKHIPTSYTRQMLFIAVQQDRGVVCQMGEFKAKQMTCKLCKKTYSVRNEKQTDVALGAEAVADAVGSAVDVVYIVSSDTDLSAAIRIIKERCPQVEVVNVGTLARSPIRDVQHLCSRQFAITNKILKKCLLPEYCYIRDGSVILRPIEYMPPPI